MNREHVLELSFSVEPNYIGMTVYYADYVGVIVYNVINYKISEMFP